MSHYRGEIDRYIDTSNALHDEINKSNRLEAEKAALQRRIDERETIIAEQWTIIDNKNQVIRDMADETHARAIEAANAQAEIGRLDKKLTELKAKLYDLTETCGAA